MARRATAVPQSQAPYRPSRVSTTPNTEPHELRDKPAVEYNTADENESPPATQSSEGDGIWWEVRQITAERRRKGKKEYRVEWEGNNKETGQPWPQEWKPCHWVTSALVENWEERKARKKRGRISSSPSPPPLSQVGICEPVQISKTDIKRYRQGRKRQRSTKENPILMSPSEEELETTGRKSSLPSGEERERVEAGEGTITWNQEEEVQVEDDGGSEDDVGPLVTKSHRRKIIESSQSSGNRTQASVNEGNSQPLSQRLVAVEIPVRSDLDSSLYVSFPRSASAAADTEDQEVHDPLVISSIDDGLGQIENTGEGFGEITIFGMSDEDEDHATAHVQVPQTQISVKDRREIPDSQSSGITYFHLTPADQKPVPETPLPLHPNPTMIPPLAEQLRLVEEVDSGEAASSPSCPQPEVEYGFENIPDSSSRVFSQDVRELKSQEAQSQSSRESQLTSSTSRSQQSQVSLPSAQLSFGKVGVTPSFQSFPDSGRSKTLHDVEQKVGGKGGSNFMASEALNVQAVKSVAGEASSFSRPDQPFISHAHQLQPTPSTNLEPLTATNIPRHTQQSPSVTDKDSFVTPNSYPKDSIDDVQELATALEHTAKSLAPRRLNTIRILQEAVESRPEDIVDSDPGHPIKPAPLENASSHDQGQGEVAELGSLPQLRNLDSCEPLPTGLKPDLLHPSLDVLSPRTPVQEEDPLQGGRSASSTPCGPIPASARPTPVTVLGYFQSQRPTQTSGESEGPSSKSIIGSSVALHQAISEESLEKAPLPLTTPRSDAQEQTSAPSDEATMSAGPVSPLLKIVDIAVAPEHLLGSQSEVITTNLSGLMPSLPEHMTETQNTQKSAPAAVEAKGARMKTPTTDGPTDIDDEYLAGSQALKLLQESPRVASDEVFLAIPLTENQQRVYRGVILNRYREIEAFYGINNTQNQTVNIKLDTIEKIVRDLDQVCSHWELPGGRKYTNEEEGPKLLKWFRKQSSKFDFLFKLLKKLRDESYSVAVVLQTGPLMDYTDIFLRSAGYQFTRFTARNGAEVVTPTPEAQRLRLFLLPSCEMAIGTTTPSVNLVIAMDSSLDPSRPHIQQLRSLEPSTQALVLHPVSINTVAHIRQYLPECSAASGSDALRDYLNPVLYAAILVRDHVGVLPQDLQHHLDALSNTDVFSWLENLRGENNLLPPLPIKISTSQKEVPATQGVTLRSSPGRKRILSQSGAPGATSIKHKRARIEVEQASPEDGGDTPTLDPNGISTKTGSDSEVSTTKKSKTTPSIDPEPEIISATTPTPSTGPTEPHQVAEEPPAAPELVDKDATVENQGPAPKSSEEAVNEPGEAEEEESEKDMLNQLTKDEVVSLVLEYQEALWQSKLQADEFERHTSAREIDYQTQRDKVLGLKNMINRQRTQIENLTRDKDKYQTAMEQAIKERDLARGELKRFQEALNESAEEGSAPAKVVLENAKLASQVESLKHKLETATSDSGFIRNQYQIASQGTTLLQAEKKQLENQVETLTRQADGVKVQLKKLNMDRERAKYQHKISELTAKLDRAGKQITSLDVEKKRIEKTRGVQTRSSSIPPRGTQSSPVPTRPGSPTITARSLRSSESA
ncbi:hypothetical protein TWF730_009423 [Orbilia blumenaviensis]|uniref:Chromo domain-containing protein n=1 Tax=Orbilia blumenaviensis TaxID=1796055 RepID=A0AAV9V0J3_9PEZI